MTAATALRWVTARASSASPLSPMVAKLSRQSALSDAECDALLALPFHIAEIGRGGHLRREEDDASACCAVLAGFAYRHKATGRGARQILAIHMQGDIIDLQGVGLGAPDYGVQALMPVTVAYIPQIALSEAVAEHPGIAGALWADTLIDASITREWLVNMGRRNARQRISHFLCELVVREDGAGLRDDVDFLIPLTQQQIGDATGLTAIHVNRTIQSMRADGFIRFHSQRMSILDWPALKGVGDFDQAYLHQSKGTASAAPGPII